MTFARRVQRNGISPPLRKIPDPERGKKHMRWCVRQHVDSPGLCTCENIPTLRCVGCQAVFRPAIGETPSEFQARVTIHATLHPEGEPGWEVGEVPSPPTERPKRSS